MPPKDAATGKTSTPSRRTTHTQSNPIHEAEQRQQAIYQELQYLVQTQGWWKGVTTFGTARSFKVPAGIRHAIQHGYWHSHPPDTRYPRYLWENDDEFLEELYDSRWAPPSATPNRLNQMEAEDYNKSVNSLRITPGPFWRSICLDYVNLSAYREQKGYAAPNGPTWPAETIREARKQDERRAKAEKERLERLKDQISQPASSKPGLPKRRGEDGDDENGGSGNGGSLGTTASLPILVE